MTFWDASAVVHLLVRQVRTPEVQALRDADPDVVVWSWTPVECLSALRRLEREGALDAAGMFEARGRLDELRRVWSEVADHDRVRARAERCLLVHSLRAADAGQLGAALVLTEGLGAALAFATFDVRLADAARREGFRILPA